jgi:uncharacterized damage-inducible protein DinB
MNVEAFRHFYQYHFAENRKIWDSFVVQLSDQQFNQEMEYSQGSVRDQIFHLIRVDGAWFNDPGAAALPNRPDPADTPDRASIRAHWDEVERTMRSYLAGLQDEMLASKPLSGEDQDLLLWQVLLHVVNHGTDHRAQLLRTLSDLGVRTGPQD